MHIALKEPFSPGDDRIRQLDGSNVEHDYVDTVSVQHTRQCVTELGLDLVRVRVTVDQYA